MTDIAIVGAGSSGSLLALQILRTNAALRVYLIEQAPQFGRGLAYGAADPEHLLNTRAANGDKKCGLALHQRKFSQI